MGLNMIKIAYFDTKDYDRKIFDKYNTNIYIDIDEISSDIRNNK